MPSRQRRDCQLHVVKKCAGEVGEDWSTPQLHGVSATSMKAKYAKQSVTTFV